MEEKKRQVLNQWLKIDMISIAKKMGMTSKNSEVDIELLMNTIRCLDYESIVVEEPSVNYIITVIGLMWEYIDHTQYDLRKIIIKILSRIGYPTSAIICDKEFDKEKGTFSGLDSWIDEVALTINQMKNEIEVANNKYLLTDYQKQIWDSMDYDKVLGISAPTSAGKSFVILLKLVDRLVTDNLDIVYIVPTLSLLNQVTEDFNRVLKAVGVEDYWISNSFDAQQISDKKSIYIMTQEKAIAAFSDSDKAFAKRLILVADEIQNIERIKEDKDQRSKILFDTLIEFRYKDNVEQIIISGPRIEEIEKVGKSIFGIETKDHTTDVSPVLNLTYSIKKIEKKYYLKQYCALTEEPLLLEIENSNIIEGYGQKVYTDKYLLYLNSIIKGVGENCQNIVFSPTSDSARKIALALGDKSNEVEKELIEYYGMTVRKNYSLCQTLEKGVAYHHGKLPMHVRRTLEKAIADKRIGTVVCTTTLLQGVNLPAQNVFIRNPHLYVRKQKESSELTNYEMANLRGRAGRLLKDYIGRTFVMDEDEFIDSEGYEQLELFEDVTKELPSGYEQKFEEYKDLIEDALYSNTPVDSTMKKYGYIISYIRQSVLKYGEESRKRMKNVGIKLTSKQVAAIILKLESIDVPKEICYKNRYWDPLVLDYIYNEYVGELPNTPMERGAKSKLDKAMHFLRDNNETVEMYNKNIPSAYREGKKRSIMSGLSLQWANGKALCEILSDTRYDGDEGADNIDNTIELLQNTISFNLPLLLKPLYDMKQPESIFLKCMQVGAFSKVERCMIEMGIPRESALFLNKEIFEQKEIEVESRLDLEQIIRAKIQSNYDNIPYWIQVQLNFLI